MTQTDVLELAANTLREGLRGAGGRVLGHSRRGRASQRKGQGSRKWAWRGQSRSPRKGCARRSV